MRRRDRSAARGVTIADARGTVIGDDNTVYQYFLSDRYAPLSQKLISFSDFIEERTKGFIGRQFVFDALDAFMRASPSGYFIVKGEPGIGKSALVAQLVKTRGYVHHFVVSSLGLNRTDQFLENVCAQLIAKFKLDRPAWISPEAGRDGAFLQALLAEVSRILPAGQNAALLVDALDEVLSPADPRENILYLPPALPNGIYIVATMRPRQSLALQVEQSEEFHLDADSAGNREDVLTHIVEFAGRPAMQRRLTGWKLAVDAFAEGLLDKAEGNFMYLHHVLPAIEAGKFDGTSLDQLPRGLMTYYERHWRQMRAINEDNWLDFRQPVIVYLAAAREPVSIDQIATWAKLDRRRVLAAVHEWREFLDEATIAGEKRYRIYHASFQDFLRRKDEAGEISLAQTHSAIADRLLEQRRLLEQPGPIPSAEPTRLRNGHDSTQP